MTLARGVSVQRRARTVVTLVVALVAVTALVAGAWPRAADAAPVRIMPLGDSITDGFNIPGGYRIELEDMLLAAGSEFDFVGSRVNGPSSLADRQHEGHSGLRIDQLAGLVDASLTRHRPDVVLLMIGTNDVLQGYRLAEAPQRLSELIDRIGARAPAATILVSSLTPLRSSAAEERVRGYNATIPGIVRDQGARGRRVAFVDMHPALSATDLADGVHPNATGYRKMAVVWRDALPAPAAPPAAPPTAAPRPPVSAAPPAVVTPVIDPRVPPPASLPSVPSPPPPASAVPIVRAEPDAYVPRRLVRAVDRRLRVGRRGIVRLRLRCHRDAPSSCSGVVRLTDLRGRDGGRTLATRRFRARPAATTSVRLRMGGRQHRRVRRLGPMRVSVQAVVRTDGRRHVTRTSARLSAR